jgi:hypothetical protein
MFPSTDDLQREYITWNHIDMLIDHLLPQFSGEFDGLIMITRSGLIPGGCLVEALGIEHVLTASIYFQASIERRLAWPTFVQFPSDALLVGRRILIVDDIWADGYNIVFAKGRTIAAGAHRCRRARRDRGAALPAAQQPVPQHRPRLLRRYHRPLHRLPMGAATPGG